MKRSLHVSLVVGNTELATGPVKVVIGALLRCGQRENGKGLTAIIVEVSSN